MLQSNRFQLRSMTLADVAQVAAIEEESFPTSWPRTAYRRELANKNAHYLVAVDGEHPPLQSESDRRHGLLGFLRRGAGEEPQTFDYLVGYVGAWNMVDEVHVVAIAVRTANRGCGVGELLLAATVDRALTDGQEILTLEVRRSNLAAQALYEKFRFLKVGTRTRYYSDNNEDAVVMSTPPIQADSYREHIEYLRQLRLAADLGGRNGRGPQRGNLQAEA